MSDILDRARQAQRKIAGDTHLTIRLEFLQDLIAEIERLELVVHAGRPAAVTQLHKPREAGK